MPASGVARPLQLRLFLEGQEVPVIGASVSIGLNAPAIASIQVLPLDEGMDLKPRTMAHLFFLDEIPTASEVNAAKTKGIPEEVFRLSYYKLLFVGEVVGFAFAQNSMMRNLVLQCVDHSSYWDAAHATSMDYGTGGNFYNQASLYGSNASIFDDIVNQQGAVIGRLLNGPPLTPGLQNVSGLAGGIIKMLEVIGGVPEVHKGVNDFFTFSELRCRVLAQITAEEKDSTAKKLFNGKIFDEWLRNGLQNIGQQVTFRDMLNMLCRYIYYDTVPNPTAKYDASITGTSTQTFVSTSLSTDTVSVGIAKSLDEKIAVLMNVRSNTLEVQKLNALDVKNSLKKYSTQLQAFGSNGKSAKSAVDSAVRALEGYDKPKPDGDIIITRAVSEMIKARDLITNDTRKISKQTGTKSSATTSRLHTQIIRPDCFFAAAPRCNVLFPEGFADVTFDRSYLSEVTRSLTLVYDTLVGRDQLLASARILAPNIGLDMAKIQSQIGEAASIRILMPHERHTGIIPRSEWLANHASISNPIASENKKLKGAKLTWANKAALFHFFKYRFGPRRISVGGKFNPYAVCGFPAVVVLKPYIPKEETLRNILKVKEGQSVDPSSELVLDAINDNATELGAPYQFLGMIGGISHQISQNGGATKIDMHHARRHLGADDEFVGIFSQSATPAKKRIKIPITYDAALAESVSATQAKGAKSLLQILTGVTPQQKPGTTKSKTQTKQKTSSVTYTNKSKDPRGSGDTLKTKDYISTSEVTSTAVPALVSNTASIEGVNRPVYVPNPPGKLTPSMKGLHGTIIGVEVIDPEVVVVPSGTFKGKQAFRSVVMHEEIQIPNTDLVPVEEIIRPEWFSANYSNPKIGEKIYMPFFGTTSVIDGLMIKGLSNSDIIVGNDPEGDTYEASKKFELIQKEQADKSKTRSRLSIERAVNLVAYFYGMVKTGSKDVDQFIKSYSSRPIATMVDVLGTADCTFSYNAKGVPTLKSGTPGFHSLSIDRTAIELKNMAGLLTYPDQPLTRVNGSGDKSPISPVYDVRWEKLQRVLNYIQAIRQGPAFRG